jgi:hypothetical protein
MMILFFLILSCSETPSISRSINDTNIVDEDIFIDDKFENKDIDISEEFSEDLTGVVIYESTNDHVNILAEENFLKTGDPRTRAFSVVKTLKDNDIKSSMSVKNVNKNRRVSFSDNIDLNSSRERVTSMSHSSFNKNTKLLKEKGIKVVDSDNLIDLISCLLNKSLSDDFLTNIKHIIESFIKDRDISFLSVLTEAGQTALMLLATDDKYTFLFELLLNRLLSSNFVDYVYAEDGWGRNILHILTQFNNTEAFNCLKSSFINRGMSIDVKRLNKPVRYKTHLETPLERAPNREAKEVWSRLINQN